MRAALWIALLGVCVAAAAGLIISVDVGSDSMKIALVKPGLPFHIVTNPQSKRKVRVLPVSRRACRPVWMAALKMTWHHFGRAPWHRMGS